MKLDNPDGHNLMWSSAARIAAIFYPACIIVIAGIIFAVKHFLF